MIWAALIETRGWKSSTEKLVMPSWVFVGEGSGPPVGGSAIGPGLAPARYTTVYIKDNINHNVAEVPLVPPGIQRRLLSRKRIEPGRYSKVQIQLHQFV